MSKYKTIKCSTCNGFGVIETTIPDICSQCKDTTFKTCCYCESKRFRGKYKECTDCVGVGEHWIDIKTNKTVLVWWLSK